MDSPQEHLDSFYRNLGMFIDQFARVESALLYALSDLSGIRPPYSQALFSGVKVDQAKSFINRLREVSGLEDDPILTRSFTQLKHITDARNLIVHRGVHFVGDWEPMVSNQIVAMPGSEVRHAIDANTLWAMILDLQTIISAISYTLLHVEAEHETIELTRQAASAPWQYKPPPPPPARKQSQRTKQAQ